MMKKSVLIKRLLKGYFGPLWGQKIKVAFHLFLLISLLEQWPKCKYLILIRLFTAAMVIKMAAKIS